MNNKKNISVAKILAHDKYLKGRYLNNYNYEIFKNGKMLNGLYDCNFENNCLFKIREEYLTKEILNDKFYQMSICLGSQPDYYRGYEFDDEDDYEYDSIIIRNCKFNEAVFGVFTFLFNSRPFSSKHTYNYFILLPKFAVYPVNEHDIDYGPKYEKLCFTQKQELAFYNKLYFNFEKQGLFRRIKIK